MQLLRYFSLTVALCTACDSGLFKTPAVEGVAQKGPFFPGAAVTVQVLSRTLVDSATSASDQVLDGTGSYRVKMDPAYDVVEVTVEGTFYDELADAQTEAPIALHAIADFRETERANVNVLTELQVGRLRRLVGQGMRLQEALPTSRAEVLSVFGIAPRYAAPFTGADVAGDADSDAVLLAASLIISKMASARCGYGRSPGAGIAEVLSDLESELTTSGGVSPELEAEILAASRAASGVGIGDALAGYYANLGVPVSLPPFEDFLDGDGDGLVNRDDYSLDFTPVTTSELSTTSLSNSLSVHLPSGVEEMATLTDGTLWVNGVDSGATTASVRDHDEVAIALVSAPSFASPLREQRAILTIGLNSGVFELVTSIARPAVAGTFAFQVVTTGVGLSIDANELFVTGYQAVSLAAPPFAVLDVSDPLAPVVVGQLDCCEGATSLQPTPDGARVWATHARPGVGAGTSLVDVSIPSAPALVATYANVDAMVVSADGVRGYAMAAGAIEVLDLSAVPAKVILGSTFLTGCDLGGVALSPDEHTFYVTEACSGLDIIDVSAPTGPALITTLASPFALGSLFGVSRSDDGTLVYVAGRGVATIDVTDRTTPRAVSGLTFTALGYAVTSTFDGAHLHVGSSRGLDVYRVSAGAELTPLGRLSTELGQAAAIWSIAPSPSGKLLYVSTSLGDIAMVTFGLP